MCYILIYLSSLSSSFPLNLFYSHLQLIFLQIAQALICKANKIIVRVH